MGICRYHKTRDAGKASGLILHPPPCLLGATKATNLPARTYKDKVVKLFFGQSCLADHGEDQYCTCVSTALSLSPLQAGNLSPP
jgi:hypothetical protein